MPSAAEGELDWNTSLQELFREGTRSLMVEGGAYLNWSLVRSRLVDEITVLLCLVILGGEPPLFKSLVGGPGFREIPDVPTYSLREADHLSPFLILRHGRA